MPNAITLVLRIAAMSLKWLISILIFEGENNLGSTRTEGQVPDILTFEAQYMFNWRVLLLYYLKLNFKCLCSTVNLLYVRDYVHISAHQMVLREVHGHWRSAWSLQLLWQMEIFCRLVSKTHCCRLKQLKSWVNSHTVPQHACIHFRSFSTA